MKNLDINHILKNVLKSDITLNELRRYAAGYNTSFFIPSANQSRQSAVTCYINKIKQDSVYYLNDIEPIVLYKYLNNTLFKPKAGINLVDWVNTNKEGDYDIGLYSSTKGNNFSNLYAKASVLLMDLLGQLNPDAVFEFRDNIKNRRKLIDLLSDELLKDSLNVKINEFIKEALVFDPVLNLDTPEVRSTINTFLSYNCIRAKYSTHEQYSYIDIDKMCNYNTYQYMGGIHVGGKYYGILPKSFNHNEGNTIVLKGCFDIIKSDLSDLCDTDLFKAVTDLLYYTSSYKEPIKPKSISLFTCHHFLASNLLLYKLYELIKEADKEEGDEPQANSNDEAGSLAEEHDDENQPDKDNEKSSDEEEESEGDDSILKEFDSLVVYEALTGGESNNNNIGTGSASYIKIFRTLLEKLKSDISPFKDNTKLDKWDAKKIALSRFNINALPIAKSGREVIAPEVYIFLDNSGSMSDYYNEFLNILQSCKDIVNVYYGSEAHPEDGLDGYSDNYQWLFKDQMSTFISTVNPAPGSVFLFWGDTNDMNLKNVKSDLADTKKLLSKYRCIWMGTDVSNTYSGFEQPLLPVIGMQVIAPVTSPQNMIDAIKSIK